MKIYPYLSEARMIEHDTCDRCKQKVTKLLKLEWQTSWSRGDDEHEKICADCISKSKKKWYKQIPQSKILKLNQTP